MRKKQLCLNCGKPMKNWVNPKTGKKEPYSWVCKCMPKGVVLSIG